MEPTTDRSPFKFLDSYTVSDRDIFFGRDAEIEEIYSKVYQSNLLLVYGASGTGKSSIINCGLANKFSPSDWLPIHVRRGGNILQSMYRQVRKAAVSPVEAAAHPGGNELEKAVNSLFLDHFKPIYFIFDQFEELFVFGNKEEWAAFVSAVRQLMDADIDVHFIFVIRGEYLEFLSEFENSIPEFFDNRMRVEKMTRKHAIESITGPCNLFSINMEADFGERLLEKLSPGKAQVELTFLQVFLDRIYRNAREATPEGSGLKFTNAQLEELGQIEDVLAEFLDEQLFRMEDSRSALTVLKAFVSLQGTKTQMTEKQVARYTLDLGSKIDAEQVSGIIREFVNKRILREKDENGQYELRHDSLAQRIFEKITHQERELLDVRQFIVHSFKEYQKRGILLNDEDLTYIAPFERLLDLDDEVRQFIQQSKKRSVGKRRSRRTLVILAVIILGFTVTSVAGFIYSQRQRARIEQLATLAQQESLEANRQRTLAEEQTALALANEDRAGEQARIALEAREEAIRQAAIAEQQRRIAFQERQAAEQEKEMAESARLQAERSESEALRQKQIADEQTRIATALRLRSLGREIALKSSYVNDPELKVLLGLQAHAFHSANGGSDYHPDIWQSLYQARKAILGEQHNVAANHQRTISTIARTGDGVYSAGHDGQLWRISGVPGAPVSVYQDDDEVITALGTSEETAVVALGNNKGLVRGIDPVSGAEIFSVSCSSGPVIAVFPGQAPDRWLVVSDNGTLSRINSAGEIVNQVRMQEPIAAAVQLNDGRLLAGTFSGEIMVLDETLQETASFAPLTGVRLRSMAAHPAGNLLLLGYEDGRVVLWNISAGQVEQSLPGHRAAVTSVAFGPQGNFLASGSFDRTVNVWNRDYIKDQPLVISDHDDWVSSIAFGKEGTTLYTGTYAGVARKFELSSARMAGGLCALTDRNLTRQEWSEYIANDVDYEKTCDQ